MRRVLFVLCGLILAVRAAAFPIPVPQAPAYQTVDFTAGFFSVDGTNCAAPAEITINGGPKKWTLQCADSDSSIFYFDVALPIRYTSGDMFIALRALSSAASPSGLVEVDVSCQCRAAGEVINSTWGTSQAVVLTFSTQYASVVAESSAIDPNGTCVVGSTVFCRGVVDATATTVTMSSVFFLGASLRYPVHALTDE